MDTEQRRNGNQPKNPQSLKIQNFLKGDRFDLEIPEIIVQDQHERLLGQKYRNGANSIEYLRLIPTIDRASRDRSNLQNDFASTIFNEKGEYTAVFILL